jgi:hypothetical protein
MTGSNSSRSGQEIVAPCWGRANVHRVPWKEGNFFTMCATESFSYRILFHNVNFIRLIRDGFKLLILLIASLCVYSAFSPGVLKALTWSCLMSRLKIRGAVPPTSNIFMTCCLIKHRENFAFLIKIHKKSEFSLLVINTLREGYKNFVKLPSRVSSTAQRNKVRCVCTNPLRVCL